MLFPLRFGERTFILITTCFVLSLASICVIFTVYFFNTHQSLPFGLTTATTTAFVQHEHQRQQPQFAIKEVTSTIAHRQQQQDRLPNLTATHHYHRQQSSGHHNSAPPTEFDRSKYVQNNRLNEEQHLRLKPKMLAANEESKARIHQAIQTTANSRNDVFDAVDDVTEMSGEESDGQQSSSSGMDTIYIDDYDRLVDFNRGAENQKMGDAVPVATLDVNQIDYFDSIIKDHKARVRAKPSVVVTETLRKGAKRRKPTQSSDNVTRSKTKGGRRQQHPSGRPGRPAKGQQRKETIVEDAVLRSFQLLGQGKRNRYYVHSSDRNSESAELINNDLIGGSGSGDFIDDDEDGPNGDTEVYISVDGGYQRNLYNVLKGGSSLSFSLNQPIITTSIGQTKSPRPFRITGDDDGIPTSDRIDLALNISRRHQWMPPASSSSLSPLTTIASNTGALTPTTTTTTTSTSHGGSVGNLNFNLKPSAVSGSGNINTSSADAELTVSPQQSSTVELSQYSGFHRNSGAWLETRARRIMGNVKKSEERSRQLLLCAEAGGGELCRMLFKGHLNE